MKQKVLLFQRFSTSMQKLLINGKKRFIWKNINFRIKNATLPILAASILTDNCKLTNVPLVKDIFTMVKLLDFIGLKVNFLKKNIIGNTK